MRHICLYIGVQIFIAGGCGAGSPEVVQEALADLKMERNVRHFPLGVGLLPRLLIDIISIFHFKITLKRAKNSAFGSKKTALVSKNLWQVRPPLDQKCLKCFPCCMLLSLNVNGWSDNVRKALIRACMKFIWLMITHTPC